MAHLDEHNFLHSYETQLITVINDWAKIVDDSGQADTFFLVFEKAFVMPHHELLKVQSSFTLVGGGGK